MEQQDLLGYSSTLLVLRRASTIGMADSSHRSDALPGVASVTSWAGLGCFASTLALYLLEHCSAGEAPTSCAYVRESASSQSTSGPQLRVEA